MFKTLKRHEIVDALWDELISESANGVIYATSFFLDTSVYTWEGIIYYDESYKNPYRAVMPIFVGRKYGLKYLAYEPYCAQLGIFSFSDIDQGMVDGFVKKAGETGVKINHYPFETSLSPHIEIAITKKNLTQHQLNCFDLREPYEITSSKYNRNRRRLLQKANTYGLKFGKTNDIDRYISLFRRYTFPKIGGMTEPQLDQLKNIYETLDCRQCAEMYEVFSGSEVLSMGMFFKFKNDLIYYSCTNSEEGLRRQSQSLLFDSVIRQYSQSNYILQAYSGNHSGVKQFYASFGAKRSTVLIWNDQKLRFKNILSNLVS